MLWFARIRGPARYAGDTIFVGGTLLGAVPRLAVCRSLINDEVMLVCCDRRWNVRCAFPEATVGAAKARAAKTYPGIERLWERETSTRREARCFLDDVVFDGLRCSFCLKRPYQLDNLIRSRAASICNHCVTSFANLMAPPAPARSSTPRRQRRGAS